MIIKVWMCPTEGCGNYFASSSAGERLDEAVTGDRGMNGEFNTPDRHHTRATCPDCWDRGERGVQIERIPVSVEVAVPAPRLPIVA